MVLEWAKVIGTCSKHVELVSMHKTFGMKTLGSNHLWELDISQRAMLRLNLETYWLKLAQDREGPVMCRYNPIMGTIKYRDRRFLNQLSDSDFWGRSLPLRRLWRDWQSIRGRSFSPVDAAIWMVRSVYCADSRASNISYWSNDGTLSTSKGDLH